MAWGLVAMATPHLKPTRSCALSPAPSCGDAACPARNWAHRSFAAWNSVESDRPGEAGNRPIFGGGESDVPSSYRPTTTRQGMPSRRTLAHPARHTWPACSFNRGRAARWAGGRQRPAASPLATIVDRAVDSLNPIARVRRLQHLAGWHPTCRRSLRWPAPRWSHSHQETDGLI